MATWQCPQQWSEWNEWLAAGLHGRNRWRLSVLLTGVLFALGRRTVSSWLRAAGVCDDFAAYYYFLGSLGRKAALLATRLFTLLACRLPLPDRLLAVLDDSPTKRYGPKVQGAGIHHNPAPGPADQKFLYGHIWVTLALAVRHPLWGTIGLPLRALLYVRQKSLGSIPQRHGWKFRTKLELAAELIWWLAPLVQSLGKTLWTVADGAYAKRPFLQAAAAARVIVVSRLRKDAALFDLPPAVPSDKRGRGRPRKYGRHKLSLAKRAAHRRGWQQLECTVYGRTVTKTCKSFLATYPPAGGVIRVVIVREEQGCQFFFCTAPHASIREIIETFADRATIEQDFHDVKEVWGAGQQQVRNIWANVAAYHVNLWMHTLVELWAWNKPHEQLTDRRASPWDDPTRRPSHADRCKALRRNCLEQELSSLPDRHRLPQKIRNLLHRLAKIAA